MKRVLWAIRLQYFSILSFDQHCFTLVLSLGTLELSENSNECHASQCGTCVL
jgi:hypothetical protein